MENCRPQDSIKIGSRTLANYSYTSDQNRCLSTMTYGTKLYFVLDASGSPIEVTYCPSGGSNAFYYYVKNLQGDVTAILNSSGTVVVQYTYDAWGNVLSISGSMASTLGVQNPFRYRGYVYDQETGLYYLQSRYYNPTWGRFINADVYIATGQGLLGNNMFAYCNNCPVNYTDLSGTAPSRVFSYACVLNFDIGGFKSIKPSSSCNLPQNGDGNYYSWDLDDLYSETAVTYSNISRSDVELWYNKISQDDFSSQSFGATTFLPDWISMLIDLRILVNESMTKGTFDPRGRQLYIEEGYTIVVLSRVYIGNRYSASENEYFIFDKNYTLVYNNVVKISYITD